MARAQSGDPLDDATRVVRAGLPEPTAEAALLPGPVLAAPYHLSGDPAEATYGYGRDRNPTWTLLERALSELEGGDAVLFASGMAAVSALLFTLLEPGDVLVAPLDGYFALRALAREHLEPRDVEVRLVPTDDERAIRAALDGATLVWLESPSNPGLDTCDIEALAGAAHAAGALVAVDNTLATPLLQRPLELGADFTVTSATKGLSGHGDLVMGYTAARDAKRAEALRAWRTRTGAVAGPFEAWLLHRSLATLDVRLQRQCASALAVARFLRAQDGVAGVRYPGLEDDPAHDVAVRQMRGFGPVVGFELPNAHEAQRFLGACRLIAEATSFGGVHSTAERRARWGADAVPEGYIRLSVGCEAAHDICTDIAHALRASG